MRRRTPAAAGVLAAVALTLGTPGTAGAADLDCSDFATQAEAQAALIAAPGDPNGLDADDDGSAVGRAVHQGPETDGVTRLTGQAERGRFVPAVVVDSEGVDLVADVKGASW